ncbi:MAG: rRNA maturation RNase YbeY [Nitrospirales bacterium]|nr:rRNA maturation RNase YbeY [Nitrospira sp.]MDR4501600.1 rRNA maturation RNase YbeY [Nitrospirales bacterium]
MSVILRNRLRQTPIKTRTLRRVAQLILEQAGAGEAELGLELVGNRRMQTLNQRYRQLDRPTDVLAFPLWEGPGPRTPLLGDVIISVPMAESQAKIYGHSVDQELAQLLTHGILHLVGYDHERGKREAQRMRRKERAILHSLRPVPKILG